MAYRVSLKKDRRNELSKKSGTKAFLVVPDYPGSGWDGVIYDDIHFRVYRKKIPSKANVWEISMEDFARLIIEYDNFGNSFVFEDSLDYIKMVQIK